jgi:hypothetical protein
MCTVTFIPSPNGVLLVSNRDEKVDRADAVGPAPYSFSTGCITFPKDTDAGGTWIAMHDNGNAAVLLNGGLEPHEQQPPYRRSRGLILLDLLSSENPTAAFNTIQLDGVEPFTVVFWVGHSLHEGIWDGTQKYFSEKNKEIPHLWSSVTLYDQVTRARRRIWFDQWLELNKTPDLEDVLHFHQFTGDGDVQNDLQMNRNGEMFTVSITGMQLAEGKSEMVYLDLKNSKRSYFQLKFQQPQTS